MPNHTAGPQVAGWLAGQAGAFRHIGAIARGARVSAPTARKWLAVLDQHGLLETGQAVSDAGDTRRTGRIGYRLKPGAQAAGVAGLLRAGGTTLGGDARLLAHGGLRSAAGEQEVTRLLREWDTATARLRELGITIPDRPGAVTMAEWAAGGPLATVIVDGRPWRLRPDPPNCASRTHHHAELHAGGTGGDEPHHHHSAGCEQVPRQATLLPAWEQDPAAPRRHDHEFDGAGRCGCGTWREPAPPPGRRRKGGWLGMTYHNPPDADHPDGWSYTRRERPGERIMPDLPWDWAGMPGDENDPALAGVVARLLPAEAGYITAAAARAWPATRGRPVAAVLAAIHAAAVPAYVEESRAFMQDNPDLAAEPGAVWAVLVLLRLGRVITRVTVQDLLNRAEQPQAAS